MAECYVDMVMATPGLSAYWRLGEPSGTNAANEVGSLAGTYQNTPTLGVTGALSGDSDTGITLTAASSEYVSVPDDPSLDLGNTLSILIWIKRASIGGFMALIDKSTNAYILRIDNTDHLIFGQNSVGNGLVDLATLADTSAYHLIGVTWDGTEGGSALYIDGVARTVDFNARTLTDNGIALAIGALSGGDGQFFDGAVDEPALFKGVLLSAAQHLAFYNARVNACVGPVPPTPRRSSGGLAVTGPLYVTVVAPSGRLERKPLGRGPARSR